MRTLWIEYGQVRLCARCLEAGADWLVLVSGGDSPHVGALSLADPAEAPGVGQLPPGRSLSYARHREAELTEPLAAGLAQGLGRKVVVAAGLHWDNFSPELLAQVHAAWQELAGRLLAELGGAAARR